MCNITRSPPLAFLRMEGSASCLVHEDRSGRRSAVRSIRCSARHFSILPWSPLSSTSGTAQPRYSAGRVYCGSSNWPARNDSVLWRPGSRQHQGAVGRPPRSPPSPRSRLLRGRSRPARSPRRPGCRRPAGRCLRTGRRPERRGRARPSDRGLPGRASIRAGEKRTLWASSRPGQGFVDRARSSSPSRHRRRTGRRQLDGACPTRARVDRSGPREEHPGRSPWLRRSHRAAIRTTRGRW